jgi:hypothetical protein
MVYFHLQDFFFLFFFCGGEGGEEPSNQNASKKCVLTEPILFLLYKFDIWYLSSANSLKIPLESLIPPCVSSRFQHLLLVSQKYCLARLLPIDTTSTYIYQVHSSEYMPCKK